MTAAAPQPRRGRRAAHLANRPKISLPPGLEGGRYKPLADEDVLRIHAAALSVLERTGVDVQASECRDIFAAAGARVDAARDRVYIPRQMVEQALKLANRDVVLYSRDGRTDLHLRDKRVHLGTGGAAVLVLDLETGQARQSRLRDLYDIGRLVDTLDNIHFYLRPVVARDVGNDDLDINTFYACLAATNKHVMGGCYYPRKIADLLKLGSLLAGGEEAFLARPFLSLNLGWVVSPLRFAVETVETLTAAVRAGIPVSLVSAPLSGATAPASLIGTLVQVTAEELAGVVYVQLLRPGHPLLMGGMPLVTDLRTGGMIGGCAELALMNAAAAQMAHFYGLPIYNSCGITESKVPDAQAGFEKGLTTAVTALAGAQYNLLNPRIIDYNFNKTSFSLGANLRLNADLALFARYSEGASYLADRITFFNAAALVNGSSSVIPTNEVKQLEGGVKWRAGGVSLFATLFYATTDEINVDPTTTPIKVSKTKYDSKGLELEAAYRLGGFGITGGLTLTDAKVKDSTNAAIVGTTPKRQARVVYQLSPTYSFGDATVGATIVGTTSSKDDSPAGPVTVTLPGFTAVNAFVNYQFTPSVLLALGANNLLNTIGYTESNDGRGAARSINGRTVKATLRYSF